MKKNNWTSFFYPNEDTSTKICDMFLSKPLQNSWQNQASHFLVFEKACRKKPFFKPEMKYQKSGSTFSIPDQYQPTLTISWKSLHVFERNRVKIIIIGKQKSKNNNNVFCWRRKTLIAFVPQCITPDPDTVSKLLQQQFIGLDKKLSMYVKWLNDFQCLLNDFKTKSKFRHDGLRSFVSIRF